MMGMIHHLEFPADELGHTFSRPQLAVETRCPGTLAEDAGKAFPLRRRKLGGRLAEALLRKPARPWRCTSFFQRLTAEGETFKARTTSTFRLPPKSIRPAARHRASCSCLLPSVRFLHTPTHAHRFTTFARVNKMGARIIHESLGADTKTGGL